MIPEIYKTSTADTETQKALQYLHQKSTPITYTSVAPTLAKVPTGGIVVHDDGSGTFRIYFRTGKDNVAYATMTQVTA